MNKDTSILLVSFTFIITFFKLIRKVLCDIIYLYIINLYIILKIDQQITEDEK